LPELLEVAAADLIRRSWFSPISSVFPFVRGAVMDANLQIQLSAAALVVAIVSLFFSLMAAFPGLKGLFAAVRDGVLWFALFAVIGGVSFVVWQRLHEPPNLLSAQHAVTPPAKEQPVETPR
jgi:hypothetical protein